MGLILTLALPGLVSSGDMVFDRSQQVVVTYTKVFVMGEFSHWEMDVKTPSGEAGCTSPDFPYCQVVVDEFLAEQYNDDPWYREDANDRRK